MSGYIIHDISLGSVTVEPFHACRAWVALKHLWYMAALYGGRDVERVPINDAVMGRNELCDLPSPCLCSSQYNRQAD